MIYDEGSSAPRGTKGEQQTVMTKRRTKLCICRGSFAPKNAYKREIQIRCFVMYRSNLCTVPGRWCCTWPCCWGKYRLRQWPTRPSRPYQAARAQVRLLRWVQINFSFLNKENNSCWKLKIRIEVHLNVEIYIFLWLWVSFDNFTSFSTALRPFRPLDTSNQLDAKDAHFFPGMM